jgi:hypothetical protein
MRSTSPCATSTSAPPLLFVAVVTATSAATATAVFGFVQRVDASTSSFENGHTTLAVGWTSKVRNGVLFHLQQTAWETGRRR